ncbi:hypothetical protein P170DRAFT_481125 [Aspergillus steynii IBT 23096]|uniref:Ribonucleases P/MRP subunit Pop8-like domain-containing protein n=1 Tax=Aspergillus steynii IBT 23096 TaxID=1392250 RepID=A0A2I2FRB1_9EURO|nr:uncharacterized protein P170DRAFT_481125 [Aspergillus steynii IBT 23096]PLB43175.1 hypothetical protein P170DRAFT_481125 [Aspergillus steynii IBT 23096]
MSPSLSSKPASIKRKAPDAPSAKPSSSPITTFVARNPPWTYLKLQLVHQPGTSPAVQSQPLDPLTARTYLTSALSQFLGLTGTTISIDILKVFPEAEQQTPTNKTAWIRVPSDDAAAVVAALSSWIGGNAGGGVVGSVAWRVCAKGNFLGALVNGSGGDLFIPS